MNLLRLIIVIILAIPFFLAIKHPNFLWYANRSNSKVEYTKPQQDSVNLIVPTKWKANNSKRGTNYYPAWSINRYLKPSDLSVLGIK